MMKKLSQTFRRKSSIISPSDVTAGSDVLSSRSSADGAGLTKLTSAYQRVLQEQNRQVVELERLRLMADNLSPVDDTPLTSPPSLPQNQLPLPAVVPKGRSKTFSAGSRADENSIPFFQPPPGDAPMRTVKGRPRWHRGAKRKNSRMASRPPVPAEAVAQPRLSEPAADAPRRLLTAPSFEPSYGRSFERGTRSRQLSFPAAADEEAPTMIVRPPMSVGQHRAERLAAGKRWKAPRKSGSDGALRPMSALPASAAAVITHRRDRVEVLPLLSTCAHLEAEIFRMKAQLDEANSVDSRACCCRLSGAPLCECAHRIVLAQSVDRLLDVLSIMEDRYDSIEQYYVKGKEYAHAMGKFYQVSPTEYSRWVEDRKSTKGRRERVLDR